MHKFNEVKTTPTFTQIKHFNPGDFFRGIVSGHLYIVIEKNEEYTDCFNLAKHTINPFSNELGYAVTVEAKLQPKLVEELKLGSFVLPSVETRHPQRGEFFVYDNDVYLMVSDYAFRYNKIFSLKENRVICSHGDLSKAHILTAEFNYEVIHA